MAYVKSGLPFRVLLADINIALTSSTLVNIPFTNHFYVRYP